jgi:hypothetical protein
MQVPTQVVPQQTPCAQFPEVHSDPAVQAAPVGFLPQLPLTHWLGAMHSAAVEQVVWQSVDEAQMKGSQGCWIPATQVPDPSQRETSVRVEPLQLWGAQIVPDAYCRQVPAPSQAPSRPQLEAPSSGHSFEGSWPAGTGSQEPT